MHSNIVVHASQVSVCIIKELLIDVDAEIRSVKTVWQFQIMQTLSARCIVDVDYMRDRGIILDYFSEDSSG